MKLYGNKRKNQKSKNEKKPKSGMTIGFKNLKKSTKILIIAIAAVIALILIIAAAVKSQIRPPEITPVPPSNLTPPSSAPGATPQPGGTDEGDEEFILDVEEPFVPEGRKPDFFTFVLAGTDLDDYHTDTLMVASYDAANKKLHVVSIPRDTQINVPAWTIKKINAAYGVGGIDRLKKELKKIIGFEPDFYAVVDLEGFVKVIDAIDGVEFDVPQNMYYVDPVQNLTIDLKKGPQKLDGEKAIQLVRFRRYAEGDIKRVQVQQEFMKALAKQVLKASNIPKIPTFAKIIDDYMKTDLELGHLAWFAQEIMKLDAAEDIEFHMLPGNSAAWYNGQSYHTLYKNQVVELVNEYLNPYTTDVSAKNLDIVVLTGDDRPKEPDEEGENGDGDDDDENGSGDGGGEEDGIGEDDDPTQPPETTPPTATQPPATQPTSTQPPSTQTPATQPPETAPPTATQPPETTPPTATQPPATEPPSNTQPPVATMEPTRPPS